MKKYLFWKIIVVWFMVLLTFSLYLNRWRYHWEKASRPLRINKLTGHLECFSITYGAWLRIYNPKPTDTSSSSMNDAELESLADKLAAEYFAKKEAAKEKE